MIKATNSAPDFEIAPAGAHIAICYRIIEIGTITEQTKFGEKTHAKVRLSWELVDECRVFNEKKGPEPFIVSQDFTLSTSAKSTLGKFLVSWRGKDFTDKEREAFDVSAVLGAPCMLSIIHKKSAQGNEYAQISAVSPLPKNVQKPKPINDQKVLSYDNFDEKIFESLHEALRKQMASSIEYKKLHGAYIEDPKLAVVGDENLDPEGDPTLEDLPF